MAPAMAETLASGTGTAYAVTASQPQIAVEQVKTSVKGTVNTFSIGNVSAVVDLDPKHFEPTM